MKDKEYHNPNDNWYYQYKFLKSGGSYKACWFCFIAIMILLFLCALFTGCTTTKYIPVETIRTEYVTKTDTFLQKDSIIYHDSVYIHSKGDTVWYEKWHTKYKDRIVFKTKIDSFIKTDSIRVPYPVERKLTKWESVKMDAGGLAIGALLVVILAIVVKWLIRLRKGSVLF